MILFIDFIIMSTSSLIPCFMNYETVAINNNLRLYRMSFLLSRIEYLPSILIYRSWNLLFSTIYKR